MGLFVRRVRTGSTATAIQIARTRRGAQTIMEHLGSAHNDAEEAALIHVGHQRIQEITGHDVTISINGHELIATTPPGNDATTILTAIKNYALK